MAEISVKTGNIVTGRFDIKVETLKKRVVVTLIGFLTADQSQVYVGEYMKAKSKVNLNFASLVVDCSEIAPFQQDFLEPLAGLFKDYCDFNKVYIVRPKKNVALMQLEKVVKQHKLDHKISFVSSLAECDK